jgi:antitoxin component YwqK of YwqJK toxin-antitoxin module
MKTSLLFIITYTLFFPCFSQQDLLPAFPNEISGEGVERNLAYFIPENRPFTGIVVDEKTKKKLGQYLNGYKNGLFTSYFKNNKKMQEGTYNYGIKEGTHAEWYESGNKKSEISFFNGKFNGTYSEWYPNGNKKINASYTDGIKNGLHTEWIENGNKKSEITYSLGKLNGLYTLWNGNGSKKYEGRYVNEEKDGLHQDWYESGIKKSETSYTLGKRNGTYSEWFPNSQMKSKLTYANGNVEDGTYIVYLDTGEKEKEMTYKNGVKINEGVYKDGYLYSLNTVYYEDNKSKKTEGYLKDGARDGEWTAWHENGNKKWLGTYKNNQQDGIWTWYFDNGDISNQEEYLAGNLVKVMYENKVHPSLSVKSKLKSDAYLYMCVSGLFLDTAYISVTINNGNKKEQFEILKQRKKLGENILSAISRRFTFISEGDAMRLYGKKRLDYEIVFSDPVVSTTYDDGKSISQVGLLQISSQVSPGYRGMASIRMKVIEQITNSVLFDQLIDGRSGIYPQKNVAFDNSSDQITVPLINKIFGLFKIKAPVEVTEAIMTKGNVKSLTIFCGENRSIAKGFTFLLFDTENPDKVFGKIKAEQVKWDKTICKIVDGDDVITDHLKSGKKLVAISSYNP